MSFTGRYSQISQTVEFVVVKGVLMLGLFHTVRIFAQNEFRHVESESNSSTYSLYFHCKTV